MDNIGRRHSTSERDATLLPSRRRSVPRLPGGSPWGQWHTLVFAVVTAIASACGDDSVPTTLDAGANPFNAGDAQPPPTSMYDDAASPSGSTAPPALTSDQPDTQSPVNGSESSDGLPSVGDTSETVTPEPGCVPVACTCPDPASPDCCPEAIPYRLAVVDASQRFDAGVPATSSDEPPLLPTYTTTRDEVWRKFDRQCGGVACHGGADNPTDPVFFKFTERSFCHRPNFGDECLERVLAPADRVMPPGTGDGRERPCADQYVRLCSEIKALQAAMCPERGEVVVDGCAEEGSTGGPKVGCGVSQHPYAVEASLARSQTNIGTCIPSAQTPKCEQSDLIAKDQQFERYATSEDLPQMLWDTDLVSLDSEVLAAHEVYSYAPTYTLFSDNAKKQRYVRVPVGKAITYNSATQDFDIPDNTRFYKTFLRQVIDEEGNIGYRKMETRLIVVRRDEEVSPGKFRVKALRATYAWSEDEQKAVLLDRFSDPLRSGEAWTDRLCPVIVDERSPRDPLKNPISPQRSDQCEYMSSEQITDPGSGLVRHYAIPGSTRCDECHMGSNNHSYVLGFNPWQADRRPAEEGGVYDPVHPDELTQLRRFIEYGIIRGIEPGEAKLEHSQGDRKPRNDHELKAQAYMLGNCAYCHSQHGFPTVENPVLATLDMYPKNGATGGVFQFPLEKESPRVRLGAAGQGRMKYINPSVADANRIPHRVLGTVDLLAQVPDAKAGPDWVTEVGISAFGPIQSLIWRNVYTPFTYADTYTSDLHRDPENAIFIHMPRNVPGYDCRAHKIMADWILSIPSEFVEIQEEETKVTKLVEVLPNDRFYQKHSVLAKRRVVDYHLSVTGQHCPTDDDIVDPSVLTSPNLPGTDIPQKAAPGPDHLPNAGVEARMNGPRLAPGPDGEHSQRIPDGIPGHAHWVTVDLNEPKGQWYPRRSDWKSYLAASDEQRAELLYNQGGLSDLQRAKMSEVLPHLDTVFVNDAQREYSLTSIPLGLWSPECNELAISHNAPTVGEIVAESTSVSRWIAEGPFDGGKRSLPLDARIHSMSPGQAVFEAICMNCHGTRFDSISPLAKTVAEVTGGRSRVANFRDGLFGPVQSPGAYASAVFTFSEGNTGASAADWQARYLLWMGLGGTLADVPKSVLSLISTQPFYGKAVALAGGALDANMLEPAAATCRSLASAVIHVVNRYDEQGAIDDGFMIRRNGGGFALDTGHYQLWESLCNYAQQPLIRVTWLEELGARRYLVSGPGVKDSAVFFSQDRTGRDTYPNQWVGDQNGELAQGISPSNLLPWCVVRPGSVRPALAGAEKFTEADYVAWFAQGGTRAERIPWCPDTLFAKAFGKYLNEFPVSDSEVDGLDDTDARDWWYRQGAINAGLAALYYMDGVTRGEVTPTPAYNSEQCAKRGASR